MSLWVLLAVVGAFVLAVGYLAALGARSPLRVLFIPPTAWSLALDSWRSNPRVLAAITSLVVCSAGLQLYFVNTAGHDPQMLLITSIVWQASMAALTAALAVPLHLFVIHRYWQAPVEHPLDRDHHVRIFAKDPRPRNGREVYSTLASWAPPWQG